MIFCHITVYALYAANPVPSDTASDGTDPMSMSIDVKGEGAIIACVGGQDPSNPAPTWTWSGLVEDYDATSQPEISMSSASQVYGSAQTGITITATPSASVLAGCAVAAAFQPTG